MKTNKKTSTTLALGILLMLSMSSCEKISTRLLEKVMETSFDLDTTKWGPLQEEMLTVAPFHKIDAHGAVGIEYHQDTTYSVKVVACQNGMDKYKVYVEEDELCIELNDSHSMNINKNTPRMVIHVGAPYIRKYDMSGACKIAMQGKIESEEDVEIEISGAAQVDIDDLKCRNFDLDADGAAKARISSLKCSENAILDIEGAGAANMEVDCKNVEVKVSGAGKVLVSGKAEHLRERAQGAAKINTEHLTVKTKESTEE